MSVEAASGFVGIFALDEKRTGQLLEQGHST